MYAIILAWPENGKINLTSLSNTSEFTKGIKIKKAKMLGGKDNLKYTQTEIGLSIDDLDKKPRDYTYLLEFTLGTP